MSSRLEKLKEAQNFLLSLSIDLRYPEDVEQRFAEIRLFSCLSFSHLFDLLLSLSLPLKAESNSTVADSSSEDLVNTVLSLRMFLTKTFLDLTNTEDLGCYHSHDVPSFHDDEEKEADT